MSERYEVPVSDYEDETDEKTGVYVIAEGDRLRLVDYSGETPHDLISLYRHEVLRLVEILTTWLASETTTYGAFYDRYGGYDDDE